MFGKTVRFETTEDFVEFMRRAAGQGVLPLYYVEGADTLLADPTNPISWDDALLGLMISGSRWVPLPAQQDQIILVVDPDTLCEAIDMTSLEGHLANLANDIKCEVSLATGVSPVKVLDAPGDLSTATVQFVTQDLAPGNTPLNWERLYVDNLGVFANSNQYGADVHQTLRDGSSHDEYQAGFNTFVVVGRQDGTLCATLYHVRNHGH